MSSVSALLFAFASTSCRDNGSRCRSGCGKRTNSQRITRAGLLLPVPPASPITPIRIITQLASRSSCKARVLGSCSPSASNPASTPAQQNKPVQNYEWAADEHEPQKHATLYARIAWSELLMWLHVNAVTSNTHIYGNQ